MQINSVLLILNLISLIPYTDPPRDINIKYHYGQSSAMNITTLSIIEGNPCTVKCSSASKPSPSYTWSGKVTSQSDSLIIESTGRTAHAGTYTCNVENTMIRSFANPQKEVKGTNNGSFTLQVLYPPKVRDLRNQSAIEGDPLTVTCPVTVGYPPETTYQWKRTANDKTWQSQNFTINKTSRTDSMFYTCTVSNTMTQTAETSVALPDTGTFYLNVWYEASITAFFIEGHRGQINVTVDENDGGIQFTCEVESNPTSTVKILFNGEILKERSNTKHISFIHSSVVCLDGGEYTCEGNNQYGQSSKKNIKLFVKCSPRSLHQMRQNITSALYVPITLSFTALAYPLPGTKGFDWFRENGGGWMRVLSNADLRISSSALQSNLTILNVSKADYGRYRVTVKNGLGNYSQNLFLEEDVITEGGSPETCVKYCTTKSDSTAVITGISLGLIVAALAIYSASITIMYKRKTTSKESQLIVKESTQKTYVNVAYKPDQKNDGVTEAESDDARQYTDLAGYSRDDRTTYEALHDL